MEDSYAVSTKQLEEKVRDVACGISSKYVVKSEIAMIKADLIIALKRFGHSVRSMGRRVERASSDSSLRHYPINQTIRPYTEQTDGSPTMHHHQPRMLTPSSTTCNSNYSTTLKS